MASNLLQLLPKSKLHVTPLEAHPALLNKWQPGIFFQAFNDSLYLKSDFLKQKFRIDDENYESWFINLETKFNDVGHLWEQ